MEKQQTDFSTIESSSKPGNRLYHGWIIVASFLISTIILYGTLQSFGVFFKSIENAFNLSRTTTSAVTSTNWIIGGTAAFLIGRALDKYGPKNIVLMMGVFTGVSLILAGQTNAAWQLFITYGVLLPLGTGAVYVVSSSTVSKWFDRRRGLALGITGAGSGLGTIAIIPLATFLITQYDWRAAYVILGIIALMVIIPVSRLLKSDPSYASGSESFKQYLSYREGVPPDNIRKSVSIKKLFGSRNFWFTLTIFMLFGACLLFVYTHLVPHITDMGFTPNDAAGILSVFGVASIVGRIFGGGAADKIGRKLTTVIVLLFQAGALLWLTGAEELWMLYVIAAIIGFSYSGFSSSMGAYIGDIFGLSQIGTTFGLLEIGFATGAAAGPAIGGLIYDNRGSYYIAFLLFGIASVVISLLVGCLKREDKIAPAGI
ncbi:MAG: MFS transporter [Dehalococcoidia bacterium]|jgi:MFS family permease